MFHCRDDLTIRPWKRDITSSVFCITLSLSKSETLPSAVIVKLLTFLPFVLYSVYINTYALILTAAETSPLPSKFRDSIIYSIFYSIYYSIYNTSASVVILTLFCLRRHVRKSPWFIKQAWRCQRLERQNGAERASWMSAGASGRVWTALWQAVLTFNL